MAAKYSASIGEVQDAAMMELSCGSRALFLFRELALFSEMHTWNADLKHTLF